MIQNKYIYHALKELLNSDKDVMLKDYQDKLNYYNSNKNKFKGILTSQTTDKWEQLAALIIKDNIYLGGKWKLDKIQNRIDINKKELTDATLTAEEKTDINKDIADDTKKLADAQKDLTDRINNDKAKIIAA